MRESVVQTRRYPTISWALPPRNLWPTNDVSRAKGSSVSRLLGAPTRGQSAPCFALRRGTVVEGDAEATRPPAAGRIDPRRWRKLAVGRWSRSLRIAGAPAATADSLVPRRSQMGGLMTHFTPHEFLRQRSPLRYLIPSQFRPRRIDNCSQRIAEPKHQLQSAKSQPPRVWRHKRHARLCPHCRFGVHHWMICLREPPNRIPRIV
jgi:hypothetical protein